MNSADLLVTRIADAFGNKKGVFGNLSDLLENQVPEGVKVGSREHARFYFFLIFNDHGTKSSNLYARFKQLYIDHQDLFIPENLVSENHTEHSWLQDKYLVQLGLRYPKQAAISWIKNAKQLVAEYDGEPLNLFCHTTDAIALFKAIRTFRGYGPKTAGLLLRVILGVGFNRQLTNVADVPLPVDIHDSRIAFMCHLYRPTDVENVQSIYSNPRHIAGVEAVWRMASRRAGVEWETIDRALWILGSRGCTRRLCRDCPINQYCDIGKQEISNAPSLFNDASI